MSVLLDKVPKEAIAGRLSELIQLGRPAIITGLFRGRPLEQIRDLQRLRKLLGETKFTISQNYTNANLERVQNYYRGRPMPQKAKQVSGTFSQYIDMITNDPSSRFMIAEQPTPRCLLPGLSLNIFGEPTPDNPPADLDLNAFGVDTVMSGCGDATPINPAPPTTALSLIFVADGGNSSDLHADRDGRDVLLYQGFGRKRVVLFPADAASRLHPVANFSTVPLARMDESERSAFVAYAGGVEHVLSPGETLFMPAFVWHHFDYLEPSMSASFRFGGNSEPDALAMMRTVHLDHYTLNILVGMRDAARADLCRVAARRLVSAAMVSYPSTREKFRAMRTLAEECLHSTLPLGSRQYLTGLVEVEDFLDGGLSGFYSQAPEGSAVRRAIWRLTEKTRDRLRRWGRKLAYWA
jgi:lysine-specific demethylase 8